MKNKEYDPYANGMSPADNLGPSMVIIAIIIATVILCLVK